MQEEGESIVRRWTFLLVGANNEDEANDLARKIKQAVPEGATVQVEPGGGIAWQVTGSTPFAVFGGLAN